MPYVTLTEAGATFEVRPVNLRKGQQRAPEYLKLNPKHKVPLLVVDGRTLTENTAMHIWVARTFPTDRMGSVIVPAYDRPGVGVAVGLVSALQGTDTVTVVRGPVDDATATIAEMQRRCTFQRITNAGLRESHVHDVTLTREAPNYRPDV